MSDVVLIGDSAPMRELRAVIATVAPLRLAVLIQGATGTGKELVAALLHQQSGRVGGLVAFNVCALSDAMFEDALFGHVKGAFTGAASDSVGFLREAHGGTAFFDEISGLPLASQAKLLRAIETGVFRPIGAARDVRSDFRTLAATNDDLRMLVEQGRFRADLKHRLSGIVLHIPSLAQRVDDIADLARHFARSVSGGRLMISPDAIALLQNTPWPGNVRELKQVVEASAAFARGIIDERAVSTALTHRAPSDAPARAREDLAARRELVLALERASWNTTRAASMLGLHRATIYRRMKRHGIDLPGS